METFDLSFRNLNKSQCEQATIIHEEVTTLRKQPHTKYIDVTHKERP